MLRINMQLHVHKYLIGINICEHLYLGEAALNAQGFKQALPAIEISKQNEIFVK